MNIIIQIIRCSKAAEKALYNTDVSTQTGLDCSGSPVAVLNNALAPFFKHCRKPAISWADGTV